MTNHTLEIERLIADVETMTPTQRLIFVELMLRSFKEHELHQFIQRFQEAAGHAHAVHQFLKTNNLEIVPVDKDNAPSARPHATIKTI